MDYLKVYRNCDRNVYWGSTEEEEINYTYYVGFGREIQKSLGLIIEVILELNLRRLVCVFWKAQVEKALNQEGKTWTPYLKGYGNIKTVVFSSTESNLLWLKFLNRRMCMCVGGEGYRGVWKIRWMGKFHLKQSYLCLSMSNQSPGPFESILHLTVFVA